MKANHPDRRLSGFSLIELLVVLVIIGLIAAIVVPNLGFITGEADKVKDKRNAQTIMLAYSTGAAAGVVWPDGDVATQVAAVVEGRKPAGGSLASMTFQSSVAADKVPGTYMYIGVRATGELFFDSSGGQNASGH
ncbi:type II secretion system protein [Prosthecobacter sp.]|uniref:type II secretion system protein n=1 Tax=Prosthecobacter sp. TaxID=1965333 RepID=UPI003784FED2